LHGNKYRDKPSVIISVKRLKAIRIQDIQSVLVTKATSYFAFYRIYCTWNITTGKIKALHTGKTNDLYYLYSLLLHSALNFFENRSNETQASVSYSQTSFQTHRDGDSA
jgi:hypothetical protein